MKDYQKEVIVFFYLSIATWIVYIMIAIIGVFIPDIGINTLLFRIGFPFSLIIAILIRITSKENLDDKNLKRLKMAYWIAISGLIVGALFVLLVFLFFIPWLFA